MATFDVGNAGFNPNLRMLETTDRAHADVLNQLFGQLINNDVAIMEAASSMFATKNAQAAFLLNLHKDGKKYGVHFDKFSINPSTSGTRLYDAAGMVAYPSTNLVRGQNDFEGVSCWYHLEVNGSVDSDGEFQVSKIRGIDDDFTLTGADVWCLYLPQWVSITIDAYGETKIISDTQFEGSFLQGCAIRTDGTRRPFVAIAKYMAGKNSSNVESSISGVVATQHSHTSSITSFKSKGTQYCGQTAQDWDFQRNLFEVAFASRNSQSVMAGCTSYYMEYPVTVSETSVERVIISKSNANNLLVGSCVSISTATGRSGNIAARKVITKIEEYDANNSAVYIDNGGTTFSTETTYYLATMQWKTGACDKVLGSCGSPTNNTSGKEPFLLFGVEMALGYWEPMGNTIMYVADHVMNPYICYDCTKLSTSGKTSDYVKINIDIPNTAGSWKYISELGLDTNNPSVRFASAADADSSKGYADGVVTNDISTMSDGEQREVLCAGYLDCGARAGLWFAYLTSGLSILVWYSAARLSATGRSGQTAA